MMSRAFKVFLLMLLGFGALWAYQFRTRDLRAWLERGEPPPYATDDLAALRSPVNRVLDPRKDSRVLATIYFREPRQAEAVPEETILADPPSGAGSETGEAGSIDPKEEEPEEIILMEAPPKAPPKDPPADPSRPKDSKTALAKKEKEKEKDGGKDKAKGKERTVEKAAEKKTDKPKAERPKAGRSDPHAAPADGSKSADESEQGLAGAAPRRRTVSHVVREKETLASLARLYYKNDTERWHEIFAANQTRIPDPDALPVGMVIDIPGVGPERTLEGTPKGQRKPAAQPAKAKAKPAAPTKNG